MAQKPTTFKSLISPKREKPSTFKSLPTPEPLAPEKPTRTLFGKPLPEKTPLIGGVVGEVIKEKEPEKKEGFFKSILRSTIGSKGVAGFGTQLGRTLGLGAKRKEIEQATETQELKGKLADEADDLIRQAQTLERDNPQRQNLLTQVSQMLSTGEGLGAGAEEKIKEVEKTLPEIREIIRTGINTALTVATFSPAGVGAGKIATPLLTRLGVGKKALTGAKALLPRATEFAGLGATEELGREIAEEEEVSPLKVVGAGVIAGLLPVVGTGLSKAKPVVINKLKNIFPTRTVEEISANILQPSKGQTELFADAQEGLFLIAEDLQTKKAFLRNAFDIDGFKGLLGSSKNRIKKIGDELGNKLSSIKGSQRSEGAKEALTGLAKVFEKEPSSEFRALRTKVSSLLEKNESVGLTAGEINEIKVLHSRFKRLFTEKGKDAGGISSEALRALRRDLRAEVEERAGKQGIEGIQELNSAWGKVKDAQFLIEDQIAARTADLGRTAKENLLQKLTGFILELPIVKQGFTKPAQTLISKLGQSLREGKVNVSQIEKTLNSLFKELKKAGMKEDSIQSLIKQTGRLLDEEVIEIAKDKKLINPILREISERVIGREERDVRKILTGG